MSHGRGTKGGSAPGEGKKNEEKLEDKILSGIVSGATGAEAHRRQKEKGEISVVRGNASGYARREEP